MPYKDSYIGYSCMIKKKKFKWWSCIVYKSASQRIPLPLVIGGSYQAQNLWAITFGAGESRELIFPIRDVHVAVTWHWLTCESNGGNFERPMSVIEGAISRTLQTLFFFFSLFVWLVEGLDCSGDHRRWMWSPLWGLEQTRQPLSFSGMMTCQARWWDTT